MLLHNLKIALRNLLKYKLQTTISIISLTVGMVCFALSALWLNYENSYDSWWPDKENIYLLKFSNNSRYNTDQGYEVRSPYPAGTCLAKEFPQIKQLTRTNAYNCQLRLKEESDNNVGACGISADDNFQEMFGIKVLAGQKVLHLRKDQVALTKWMADQLFPKGNAIGQKIWLDYWDRENGYMEVVSIIEDSRQPSFMPYSFIKGVDLELYDNPDYGWSYMMFYTFVKVAPSNVATLSKSLQSFNVHHAISNGVITEDGTIDREDVRGYDHAYSFKMVPLTKMREQVDYDSKKVQQNHLELFVVLGFIVICCALFNYFTMLITRIRIRQRELVLRYVNGACKWSLVKLIATELFIVISIAMTLALIIVGLTLKSFKEVSTIQEPNSFFYGWFLIYALGVALVSLAITAVIIYVTSRHQLGRALNKHADRPDSVWTYRVNIFLQLAASICTVFCSVVMIIQVNYLFTSPDMGFTKQRVMCAEIGDGREGRAYTASKIVQKALKSMPEVEEVLYNYVYPIPDGFQAEETVYADGKEFTMGCVESDEDYFRFMGMQMVDGEFITRDDPSNLICINEAAAKALGEKGKVGAIIESQSYFSMKEAFKDTKSIYNLETDERNVIDDKFFDEFRYQIKGIVKDLCYMSPTTPTNPLIFRHPIEMSLKYLFQFNLLFKYKEGTDLAQLQKRFDKLNEQLKADGYYEVFINDAEKDYDKYLQSERTLIHLLMIVSLVSVLIAVFGILSIISLACERRRKEIAIRKVHGAKFASIVMMFLKEYIYLLVVSAMVAFPIGYYFMHNWLIQYTKQVPLHWWICPSILLAMTALIFFTIYWQIRKAANENPANVIKSE